MTMMMSFYRRVVSSCVFPTLLPTPTTLSVRVATWDVNGSGWKEINIIVSNSVYLQIMLRNWISFDGDVHCSGRCVGCQNRSVCRPSVACCPSRG